MDEQRLKEIETMITAGYWIQSYRPFFSDAEQIQYYPETGVKSLCGISIMDVKELLAAYRELREENGQLGDDIETLANQNGRLMTENMRLRELQRCGPL